MYSHIDELNEQSMLALQDGQCEKALALSIETITIATDHNYQAGLGRALWNKGWALCQLVQFDDALQALHKSTAVFQELGDSFGISRSLQGIGNVYFLTGRLPESLEEYLNSFAVMELAGIEKQALGLLGNIAYTYKLLGEYLYAIEYAQKQLTLARLYSIEYHIAKALNSLGSSYFHLGDYATSLNYFTEGLALAIEKKDLDAESWIHGNIGSVYLQLDNYTGALDSMMKSVVISEHLKDQRHLGFCFNQICSIYRKMNNQSLALDYAMRALANYTALADRMGEANVLLNIARIFEQNSDFSTAFDYAQKSYAIHHDSHTKEGEAEALLLIASCANQLENQTDALHYAQNALAIADDIQSHTLLQSCLQQLETYTLLVGDTSAASIYSRRRKTTSKIIAKDEQRKNAKKLMLETQFQKTRQQAQLLISSANSSLTDDFLNKTSAIKQQGFVLAKTALPNFSKKNKINHLVSVQTFGHFSVTIGNRKLTTDDWQRKKARDIFKILLMNHRKSVSADELIDKLWGNTTGKNLIPTLWNCITYIRKALEPDIMPRQPSVFITIVGKNYMLDLGANAEIDFLLFKDLVYKAQKQTNPTNKTQFYEQAVVLYSGDFLKEDAFEDWSSFERESLKELYIASVVEIGNFYLKQGDALHAIANAKSILEIDHVQENAYQLLFTALNSIGNTTELAKSWAQCKAAYKREFLAHPPTSLARLAQLR
jgi:two-component SAPR family response regulator